MATILASVADWTVKHGLMDESSSFLSKEHLDWKLKSWTEGISEARACAADVLLGPSRADINADPSKFVPVKVDVHPQFHDSMGTPRARESLHPERDVSPPKDVKSRQSLAPPPGLESIGSGHFQERCGLDEDMKERTSKQNLAPLYPPGDFRAGSIGGEFTASRQFGCTDVIAHNQQDCSGYGPTDDYLRALHYHAQLEQFSRGASYCYAQSARDIWLQQAQYYSSVEHQHRHAADQCFARAQHIREVIAFRRRMEDGSAERMVSELLS